PAHLDDREVACVARAWPPCISRTLGPVRQSPGRTARDPPNQTEGRPPRGSRPSVVFGSGLAVTSQYRHHPVGDEVEESLGGLEQPAAFDRGQLAEVLGERGEELLVGEALYGLDELRAPGTGVRRGGGDPGFEL